MLLAVGALFAAVTLLNNLVKATARSARVSFWDIALPFLTVLVPVAALVVDAGAEMRDGLVSPLALGLGLAVTAVSLLIVLIELFRPERLKDSRGLFGVFTGLLLAFSAVFIPFAAVFIALQFAVPAPPAVAAAATPAAAGTAEASPDASETTAAVSPDSADSTDDAAALFTAVRQVIAEEVGSDEGEIFARLDAGEPLSTLIEERGGSVDRVVERLSELLRIGLRESIDRGETSAIQGAFFLSQIETVVRLGVTSDLTEFGRGFGGPTPEGTRQSLVSLLTETPSSRAADATGTARAAATAGLPTPTPAPTDRPADTTRAAVSAVAAAQTARSAGQAVPTAMPTADAPTATDERPAPTATPTAEVPTATDERPAPTVTPSRTRFTFQTRTPTATPTGVTPCIASVTNNLRLRAAPSAEAETLVVIPFTTTLLLTARSLGETQPGQPTQPPTTWYATEYEGQGGWVDGAFLQTTPGCALLPLTP
jgi:hypothetical protein